MNADAGFSLPNTDFSTKVPVEHLDYDFIAKCKDVKYLEKLLRILRSGEEGIYPHLIKFCESHLEKLSPKSRALRQGVPVATEASFSKDEWNQIIDDLRCLCEMCLLCDPGLSRQEKLLLANREKDKGNEAFRAKDYEEAVAYYQRSLSIIPTLSAYNNRAQAEINLEHWNDAMIDCQQVLELEPGNKKALLRRATVYNHIGNFEMASKDLRKVLQEEPNNAAATVGDQNMRNDQLVPADHISLTNESMGFRLMPEHIKHRFAFRPASCETVYGASAPAERGDMGNAQKKPHSRGDGGPHSESSNSHHGHWKGKGATSEKYKVPEESKEKVANGSSKRGSTASAQGDKKSSSSKAATGGKKAEETVNLDAPCGALPPHLSRLKNEGNLLFKNGQFADALEKYSQAIQGYADSGDPQDLCILYSNRAACYLKDGNSQDCIQDCTRALELQPFSLKPLLRRAMAYESLERYRKAYVDYKTVLQIDISVQAAHDSINREKLPDIPLVPLSAQQHRREEPPSEEVLQARAQKASEDAGVFKGPRIRFSALKQEGNEFVKKGQYQEALGKYTECLKLKPKECAIYTNRALCYLKLERFTEAKQDCDAALGLERDNKKAFYRRALANKGLKDYLACSSDLQEVLRLDPNVQEAEKELEEVTVLLRQSLANSVNDKPRKAVPITEVDGDEETPDVPNREDDLSINLTPGSSYEFGQSLNAARCSGNTAACAELLASIEPELLPRYLSNQLDGHTIGFIMKALDSHLLGKNPNLVYRHLERLHTADRFQSSEFTQGDVHNLANKYV
uniref:Sperm associated antigen 1 n=1 Tax=Cyprinodon variegatus TaxID=28743 RepID=A0A3Q2D2E4_CYPVA